MDQEAWLTVEEVGQLTGVPVRTLKWRCQNDKYLVRKVKSGKGGGKGGEVYEIALSSLPKEARNLFKKENPDRFSKVFEAGQLEGEKMKLAENMTGLAEHQQRESALLSSFSLTGKAQARNDHKTAIVAAYYRTAGGGKLTPEEFAPAYNRGEIEVGAEVKTAVPRISAQNFRRWLKAPAQGKHLGGNYGHRKGSGLIDSQPELREFVLGLLAAKPHIAYTHLYQGIAARFRGRADVTLPSERNVQRWAAHWKERQASVHTLLTNPDQWNNEYRVAHGTINYAEYVNHIWRLDSTPNDVVLNDGKRHAILFVLDNYSKRLKIMVAPTSKATSVALGVRRAILDWGTPIRIATDQGAEYTGLHMGRICGFLGIEHHICNPFAGWEKGDVERVGRTFLHGITSLLPGFLGHNVAEQQAVRARKSFAERLMDKDAEPPELRMDPEAFQKFADEWCENIYHHTPHDGLDGKTPFQQAAECRQPVRWVGNERVLDILLAEAAGGDGWRTVHKKGIKINKEWYVAAELGLYVDKRVRCLDLGPGRISVWGEDRPEDPLNPNAILPGLHFICIAECAAHMAPGDRMAQAKAATATQSRAVRGDAKKIRAIGKKVDADGIAQEILEDQKAQTATVHAFPKRKITHATAATQAAQDTVAALDALDRENQPVITHEEVQAMRESIAQAKRVERPMFENAMERVLWLAAVRMGDIEAELSGEDDEFLRELRRANPLAYRLADDVLNHRYEGRWEQYGEFRRAVGWPEARRPKG